MQAIAKDVFIETRYPGVTLGVINTPHGLIHVDAPPSIDDGRSWRATLLSLDSGSERVLINLDSHTDRTLGARTMECTTIAHEKAAQVFRSRPNLFKTQSDETGADWELLGGIGNIRWTPPEITFTRQMGIYWGDSPVLLEYHPGPSVGASWVKVPDVRVVFIGDAVVPNVPPFLALSNIPDWLETLKELLTPAFRGYQIVSGRGGIIQSDTIRAQVKFLKKVDAKLQKMAVKQMVPEAIGHLVDPLLEEFTYPSSRRQQYTNRLRYGLFHYYSRHFHELNNHPDEDD